MFNFSLNIKTEAGRELIAPFSMSLNQNDRVALIGEEGNGKSLTLKALVQDNSLDELHVSRTLNSRHVVFGYLSQEMPRTLLEQDALSYIIKEQWNRYGDVSRKMKEVLPHFEMEDLNRPMHSYSGGERVRLQLLQLMVHPCDCYLLDEPSNDLDLETLMWLEGWMLAQTKPIIFVSHEVMFLQTCANRIVHLEQTHRKTRSHVTVYEGDYQGYCDAFLSQIQKHNHDVKLRQKEKQKQEARWHQLYQKVEHRQRTQTRQDPAKGRLLKKKMHTIKSMERRFEREVVPEKRDFEGAIKLSFEEQARIHQKKILDFHLDELVREGRILACDLDIVVYSRDRIAIVGSNGVGKTTFLHEIIKEIDAEDVGVMHQSYDLNLDYDLSPIENCVLEGSRDERGLITNHLGSLKFTEDEMNTPMERLSGGQKAKVSLLKLVLKNPKIIILDEPTRNLSPLSVGVIYHLLNNYQGGIISVTHDRALIQEVMDDVYSFDASGLKKIS
ncbi:ABC transporter ATP-binding protein [Erysipelothrix piscisicarius]|uniref:ABC transporter ATP-binding protein n=1 Tax=Erysipelothrix piscisicarius TaxID=2485784 RepID=A0A3Q8S2Q0_9FIRM|nr:ATP-binding cassette domain-containing protein [Erysipelothrix piscisicarius]AZK44108.1 ABC transporter ATP-binding protein [Erysipelothrix piscisicarius]